MKPDLSLKCLLLAQELSGPQSLRPYAYLISQVSYAIANSSAVMPVSVERLAWLVSGVGQIESGWLLDRPVTQRIGLMGLDLGLHAALLPNPRLRDLRQSSTDPLWSVELGAGVLRALLEAFSGNEALALSAYRDGRVPGPDASGPAFATAVLKTIEAWQQPSARWTWNIEYPS